MAFYQKQRCKCDFFFTWPLNPPATTKSSNPSAGTASHLIHSPVNFVRRFVSINNCHHITSITPIKVIFSSLCFNFPKMICKTPYTKEIRWMKRKDDDDNLIIAWSRRNEKQEAQKSMPTKEWKKILITMNKEQTNKRWRGWNEWPKPFSFSVSDYPFPMTSNKKRQGCAASRLFHAGPKIECPGPTSTSCQGLYSSYSSLGTRRSRTIPIWWSSASRVNWDTTEKEKKKA